MKTRNDILAEYVRSRYPEIEKTFDFAAYSAGVALKEFGRCIKEAFGGRRCLRFRTLRPGSFCMAQTIATALHENAHLQLYRRSRTRLLG